MDIHNKSTCGDIRTNSKYYQLIIRKAVKVRFLQFEAFQQSNITKLPYTSGQPNLWTIQNNKNLIRDNCNM